MEELMEEFREWERDWKLYDGLNHSKPMSVQEFIKELSKTYKVTKIENNE